MKKLFGSFALSQGDGIIQRQDEIVISYEVTPVSIETQDDALELVIYLNENGEETAYKFDTPFSIDIYGKQAQAQIGDFHNQIGELFGDLDMGITTVLYGFIELIYVLEISFNEKFNA